MRLEPHSRATLLQLARAAIADRLGLRGSLETTLALSGSDPELDRRHGLFVTLERSCPDGNQLRGCVGSLVAQPLRQQVVDLAPKAAMNDPRFPPLAKEELDGLLIHISVLSELAPVDDVESIDPDRHGVQLVLGSSQGVFLPQVARRCGWDRQTLLERLSRKAGLPEDAWKRAALSVFESLSFDDGR